MSEAILFYDGQFYVPAMSVLDKIPPFPTIIIGLSAADVEMIYQMTKDWSTYN